VKVLLASLYPNGIDPECAGSILVIAVEAKFIAEE